MTKHRPGSIEGVGAEDWYRSVPLGDGVTHIFEPYIGVFYRCNIWHVAGRHCDLLVDTGSGVVSLVAQHRWLRPNDILAVASHSHFDHIGGHHLFPNRACHSLEAGILSNPTAANTVADRFATLSMFTKLPPGGYAQDKYRVTAAPATRLLEHGDVIDLADRQFEILHVPGHSPGSIALWEKKTGILFSGDAVYDGPLVDDAYHSDVGRYLDTMRRLRELPVTIVHGGHYPSFGRDRYRELIDSYCTAKSAEAFSEPASEK